MQAASFEASVVHNSNQQNFTFDKVTGKFIITVQLNAEQYSRCAQDQLIADMQSVRFDKNSDNFFVPVYMTPEDYTSYVQQNTLPLRY